MIDFAGKKVLIMGLGKSGLAAAKLLGRTGAKIKISELRKEEELKEALAELKGLEVEFEFGGHSQEFLATADVIVISPGIPLDLPVLVVVKKTRVPIISEIELGYQILVLAGQYRQIVAVTGTNGKTTTTILIGEILKAAGRLKMGPGQKRGKLKLILMAGRFRSVWLAS